MGLRIVRLGTPRAANEGLRLGTVRRPPRGVRREDLGRDDWYDVWLPQLSPSAELLKEAQGASSEKDWQRFARKYEAEMKEPDNARLIALLAALSKSTNLAAGCYCADETRCHRSLLRKLLEQAGAEME
jgi:uncharacterized protein YeaO (DUF488 family)